jgi:hypothetical protein
LGYVVYRVEKKEGERGFCKDTKRTMKAKRNAKYYYRLADQASWVWK